MLFNSINFAVFFVIVASLYFAFPFRYRPWLLLAASSWFYMAFVPVYIFILAITIVVDYFSAIWMERSEGRKRKRYLLLSLATTIGVLFVFKYFNFFADNANHIAQIIHWNYSVPLLKILLPIGLSFHTFQGMSYIIEVYRGRQKAEKNFNIYALYVMFFPQLVAGPIERPQNLLHQFYEEHIFDYQRVVRGLQLMAWGLFKKVVIADRLAFYVNHIYENVYDHSGVPVFLAIIFFSFQIYCDFSGYSDIARGSAEVLGFRLMKNFNRPYFSKSISEFWRRWHISLSTWFKDYLYLPLGGSRVPAIKKYRNILIVFVVSGLWHGANWTYIIWGGLHGIFLIIDSASIRLRKNVAQILLLARHQRVRDFIGAATTFLIVSATWVFFRAENFSDAVYLLRTGVTWMPEWFHNILNYGYYEHELFSQILIPGFPKGQLAIAFFSVMILVITELFERKGDLRNRIAAQSMVVRWVIYYCLIMSILVLGYYPSSPQPFIYFQF